MASLKKQYTFFYIDGSKRVGTTDAQTAAQMVQDNEEISFAIEGTDTDRYVHKGGLWTTVYTKGAYHG